MPTETDAQLATLLERYAERREMGGEHLSAAELCTERPELTEQLEALIATYDEIDARLSSGGTPSGRPHSLTPRPLLELEGFRTIERIGAGGMGEVYKLEDLELGRTVAAKVMPGGGATARYGDFLREARALALFSDPRIVQVYELRSTPEGSVLLMEYVDGFELSTIGPSLTFRQRARVMSEVCAAVEVAHGKGLQHRDLKPANILLDSKLQPKILDFGLSGSDPLRGHGAGTPAYAAPEQLAAPDEGREPAGGGGADLAAPPIDARADVYSLGVVLYELLTGERPYAGATEAELLAAVRAGRARLPVEIAPEVPEPLQAIALKAMEADPRERYASAREMARELERYLDGRPVTARPSLYASALERRVLPQVAQFREWLALKLIYPHEASGLEAAYGKLLAREDDWIVESRRLSASAISLYLGAFLMLLGGLFYFTAYRLLEGGSGLAGPMVALGLPFVGVSALGLMLERRGRKGLAVALYLGAAALLPVFLLLIFAELGWWAKEGGQLLEGVVSDRQTQVAAVLSAGWAFFLARRTRTVGLAALFTTSTVLAAVSLLADFGLRSWLEEERWDLLALHLLPLVGALVASGWAGLRAGWSWLTTPLWVAAAGLWALCLELVCLHGRLFAWPGFSLDRFEPAGVSDSTLLETVTAATLAGLAIYATGAFAERSQIRAARLPSRLLLIVSPFAVLEPLSWLNMQEEYAPFFAWLYLALALAVAFASMLRQRKSFYYAGLLNTAVALYLIAERYDWLDLPAWATAVLAAGLSALAIGLALDWIERQRAVKTHQV